MTTQQEFNCIFCKDVFGNKEDLQEHFRKHGDPKYKNRFEVDTQTPDEKSKEKAEMVSCDVCSQVFPTISKAITHKHKVHPDHDAKYFCPWCGKLFTMKHLYNVHVQSTHGTQEKTEGKRFHCDSCSVEFYIPSAMINHNKFFHRQDTDLPDVGGSKKIRFYNQEIVPIYYCAFCGEEYESKVNLIKHMSDDHGDENQSPDEVLKCPACDAVFYHLDAYEIHLTFHSSDDMYSVNNSEYTDLLDYSLETVPPIIEKVENLATEELNQDTETESTMNAVGIERFLELAMDQSDDSNPVKVKKHKKRKKSKKSAITLDEFLSMNQDVFGEGLDFQGIEEVPTRIVKKQLKNNKKAIAATTSAELEKLKKAGIVIKRQVTRKPAKKGLKVPTSKPIINVQNQSLNEINPEREIKTSSEVLTKLINQSNNQIKIVKKVHPNNATNESKLIEKDAPMEDCENRESCDNMSENVEESNQKLDEVKNSPIPKIDAQQGITDVSSQKSEELSVPNISDNRFNKKYESYIHSDNVRDTTNNTSSSILKTSEDPNFDHSPKSDHKTDEASNVNDEDENQAESAPIYSDPEPEERDNASDTENCEKNDDHFDENPVSSEQYSHNDNKVSATASSLTTLKRLSHLITVKPVSQNKNSKSAELTISKCEDKQTPQNNNEKETSNLLPSTDKLSPSRPKVLVEKDSTIDALKNLSKNITIKSMSTKRNIDESESEDISEINSTETTTTSDLKNQDMSNNKNIKIKKIKVESNEPKQDEKPLKLLKIQEKKCHPEIPLITKPAVENTQNKITLEQADNSMSTSNANILKRLTNITTKPLFNKIDCQPSTAKQTNVFKKFVKTEEKKEEIIEIFDIDDSEDEKEINNKEPEPPKNTKSMDALKNLNKNIIIKSLNQTVQKDIIIQNNIKIEKEDNESQSNIKVDPNIAIPINKQNKNMAFKNVLQGLSKNITIKSRNSSPSQFKSQEYNTQDSHKMEDNEAPESDFCPGNIKITEMDDDMSDNEDAEKIHPNHNYPIIESPNDSCSENEELNEEEQDFETDIKASTVEKKQNMTSTINSACLNNLKNMNITIKSLSKNTKDNEDKTKQAQTHEAVETPLNQKKQLPMKSSKQLIKEPSIEKVSNNMISKNVGQIVDHTATQSSSKKMSAVNQVNTVNKEVTVKTYQTQTVIEEITTTVTKTIRRVNQTMQQDVRNTCQTSSPMLTQRVQGIRPSQPKNLQGVVIRHASPPVGPRTSNVVSQIRPAGTAVRPSQQIIPMRAGINSTRPNNHRMPLGKKVTPSPSPNKQVIGKPLKISPAAMASTLVKRPNTEDLSGPFSCFKKPKESLIPVSEIPILTNSGGGSTAQFTAASHSSSSNFTSTTKIIKGNSVMTAKQMKSEVNATSQQMTRFSSPNTGLKVMTSQVKQSQVQEKTETSAMKRTTLEAIQRLQQQGLLVKKPRVDVNEGSGDSDHDVDHNIGYNSADENDE